MSEFLSILIPIHEKHHKKFQLLHDELNSQIGYGKHDIVEVYPYLNNGEQSIGHYRNELLSWAKGEYLCFIDSDDRIAKDYITTILKALESKPDCLSLRGEITIDGGSPELFEHSIKYSEWKRTDNKIKYERNTNHLNVVKSEVAKAVKFPDKDFGEDSEYSQRLLNSGLLKKEVYIDKILYYYDYISNK
jgi:glycosyltransferase involved in cell wall biosynthesis